MFMESERERRLKLQVLICTYGKDGIGRVAEGKHPPIEGVEYLVSWQTDEECPLPKALVRDDFLIFRSATKGLAVNRNIALSKASAPILLISDDDVDYYEDGLNAVISAFHDNTEADIITFCYKSIHSSKNYPSRSCCLEKKPKGYYVSSIEIAFRRHAVQKKIWFNENFGIGASFPSGEEDIFLKDCLDKGLKGMFLPITIASHDETTTSERNLMLTSRPQTKGAVFLRLHPYTWPLRMMVHAVREIPLWRKGLTPSPLSYCYNWIKGMLKAKRDLVFPTPDYYKTHVTNDNK